MSEDKKPVRKRRVGNPALTGDALNLEPGDNTRALMAIIEIDDFPPLDINNPQEVAQRINDYFKRCAERDFKPLVSGLAGALQMTRRELWAVVNGHDLNGRGTMPKISPNCINLIKKGYANLERLMEYYMENGKINPVSGIFLAKNHFNYVDKVDHVITPGVQPADFAAEDIASRYLTDSDPAPTLPEGTDSPTLTDSEA